LSIIHAKATLRALLKAQREQLTAAAVISASQKIIDQLCSQSFFINSYHIAGFWPVGKEIDLRILYSRSESTNKCFYLPVIDNNNEMNAKKEGTEPCLHFASYKNKDYLQKNRFGIYEPASLQFIQNITTLDLILLPLLGFDAAGNRLGMGGGFYDRALACLHQAKNVKRPILIGLGYEFQRQERLPTHPWDIPLQGVITENRYTHF